MAHLIQEVHVVPAHFLLLLGQWEGPVLILQLEGNDWSPEGGLERDEDLKQLSEVLLHCVYILTIRRTETDVPIV